MSPDRPNILFITSDQHRADSMGCSGHPCVRTPHLDQLAYEGVRMDQCFSECPVCIPARTTLITGIQSHRYGSPSYNANFRIEREREKFLGSLITAAGYQTCLLGKRHWHTEPSFRAGFETHIGDERLKRERLREMGRPWGSTGLGLNEIHAGMSIWPDRLDSVTWQVDETIDFLDTREKEQPFFVWYSTNSPHPPFQIHEPYYSMYDHSDIPEPVHAEWSQPGNCPRDIEVHRSSYNPMPIRAEELRKSRVVYYGMITHLDHQLGRLFGYLMANGLYHNTWIVYTSDHGEFLGDFGNTAKSAFTNCAARIPLLVRPPRDLGYEPGRVSNALVSWPDLLPTFCDIAGATTPDDICGQSFLPVISGETNTARRDLHGHIESSHMYHDGRYKYLYFVNDGKELVFDTIEDRNDQADLSHDEELTGRLREAFIAHLAEEGHHHLEDGKLINRNLPLPSMKELRGKNTHGWGGIINN